MAQGITLKVGNKKKKKVYNEKRIMKETDVEIMKRLLKREETLIWIDIYIAFSHSYNK